MAIIPKPISAIGLTFRDTLRTKSDVIQNGGSITGTPTFSNGATFDGSNYIEYNVIPKSSGSISVWMRASNVISGKVAVGSQTAAPNERCYIGFQSSVLVGGIGTHSWAVIAGGTVYVDTWHHGVITWNGTTVNLYLDGSNVYSAAQSGEPANRNIYIGASNYSSGVTAQFIGDVRDAQIYNRALSLSEAQDIYNATTFSEIDDSKALVSLPLKSQYNTGSLEVTENIGSLGGTSQLGDGTTSTTFPTLLIPHGMSFDGGDYLEISDNDALSFGNGTTDSPFSICALINLSSELNGTVMAKAYSGGVGEYIFGTQGGGILYSVFFDGSASAYIGRSAGSFVEHVGKWTHVCLTYDGSSTSAGQRIYINGVRSDTGNNQSGSYVAMEPSAYPLTIGRLLTTYASGKYLNPQLFPIELTPTQVIELSNRSRRGINL